MVELLQSIATFTGIMSFMNSAWGWPIIESLHFTGMCLLIGSVGIFDLRILGIAPGVPLDSLHRLIPIGILGFALNVTTGFMFLISAPDQYLFNPAFQTKMSVIVLAGFNMILFYRFAFRQALQTSAGSLPRVSARTMGAISLACWATVIVCGRLITYFRPPYHWCFWC